jgi:hypothetical protein
MHLPSRFVFFRIPLVQWCSLLVTVILWSGCQRAQSPVLLPDGRSAQADLDETAQKLATAEKSLAKLKDELALAGSALDSANHGHAELEKALNERDTQLRAAKAEIEALKKRDAFVFADISAVQQEGQTLVALSRYEKFIRDFPNSPLTAHATRVVNEMTVDSQRETKRRQEVFDPRRPERELVKLFNEGLSTPQELAPLLKNKTRTQVLAALGRPSQTFNDGAEVGYVDRATNPATGKRGMLIISFTADTVSSVRLEYAGRKIVP